MTAAKNQKKARSGCAESKIDIVNLMQLGIRKLPGVYQVDTSDITVNLPQAPRLDTESAKQTAVELQASQKQKLQTLKNDMAARQGEMMRRMQQSLSVLEEQQTPAYGNTADESNSTNPTDKPKTRPLPR